MFNRLAVVVPILCVCVAFALGLQGQEQTPVTQGTPNQATSTQGTVPTKPATAEASAKAQAPGLSESQKAQDAKPESQAAPPNPPSPPKPESATPAFSNADVIGLTKDGMSNEVVILKINAAKQVSFSTEASDLRALKEAGVSQEVIAAMIRRSSEPEAKPKESQAAPPDARPRMGGYPGLDDMFVRLVTQEGTTDLRSIGGSTSTTWAYWTSLIFMDYPNAKAEVRIKDRRPYLLVETRKSPMGRVFLVHCDPDSGNNKRSVKMGRSGAFSVGGFGAPDNDSDWTVPVSVKEQEPNLWRIDPTGDLKPGEYGVWGFGGELYDFGVDKEPKVKPNANSKK